MLKKLMCGIMVGLALTGAFTALAATNTQTVTEGKAAERQMVEAAYNFRYTHLSAKNAVSGNKVTAKAVTAGNASGVKYKFVVSINNWESWYVAQYPSTKTSAVITAKKAGTYRVYVDAILPNGKVVTKSNTFTVSRPWSLNSVSGPTKGRVGSSIGIAPQVKGSGTGMRYKYVWQKDNWKQWGVIRQFSTAKNARFTPKTPGNYTLYIDAMDTYGNVVTRTKQVTVYNYDVNLKASVVSAKVGGKVNVSASGAPAGSRYKFVASYDNWKHWHVIQNFSTKNTASFAPKYSGSLQVYVDVKYGGNITTKVTTRRPIAAAATNQVEDVVSNPKIYKTYYVCNGCGYKSDPAKYGSTDIHQHLKKRTLAGHDECGSYRTQSFKIK